MPFDPLTAYKTSEEFIHDPGRAEPSADRSWLVIGFRRFTARAFRRVRFTTNMKIPELEAKIDSLAGQISTSTE